jgi:hypothetical protein
MQEIEVPSILFHQPTATFAVHFHIFDPADQILTPTVSHDGIRFEEQFKTRPAQAMT